MMKIKRQKIPAYQGNILQMRQIILCPPDRFGRKVNTGKPLAIRRNAYGKSTRSHPDFQYLFCIIKVQCSEKCFPVPPFHVFPQSGWIFDRIIPLSDKKIIMLSCLDKMSLFSFVLHRVLFSLSALSIKFPLNLSTNLSEQLQ